MNASMHARGLTQSKLRRVLPLVGLCFVLTAAVPALALCEDGVILFPAPGATVPTNVQFVLEGVLGEQDRIAAIVGNHDLLLLGKGASIAVSVEKGWSSTMNRVAVKLRPKKALEPNTEYTLTLSRLLPRIKILNDTWGDNTARWRTGPAADTTPPRFTTRPAVSEGLHERTKDGLTRAIKFRTQLNEAGGSAYLVVSMARARGIAAKQQYLVPVDGDVVTLGHDVCSGSFGFDDGRAYKLTIDLFDAAGNRASTPVNLELSAPRPSTPEPSIPPK
jgi:hypothetical protein